MSSTRSMKRFVRLSRRLRVWHAVALDFRWLITGRRPYSSCVHDGLDQLRHFVPGTEAGSDRIGAVGQGPAAIHLQRTSAVKLRCVVTRLICKPFH